MDCNTDRTLIVHLKCPIPKRKNFKFPFVKEFLFFFFSLHHKQDYNNIFNTSIRAVEKRQKLGEGYLDPVDS
jgi:hypothetical protein